MLKYQLVGEISFSTAIFLKANYSTMTKFNLPKFINILVKSPNILPVFFEQGPMLAWFLHIAFVRELCRCMCVCAYTHKHFIIKALDYKSQNK